MLENGRAGETTVFNVQGSDLGRDRVGVKGGDFLLLFLLQCLQIGAHQLEMGEDVLTWWMDWESGNRGGRERVKVNRPLLLHLLHEGDSDRAGEKAVFNVQENLLCTQKVEVKGNDFLFYCLLHRLQRRTHQVQRCKRSLARGKDKDSNGRGGRIRVKVDRPLLLPLLNEVDGRFEQVECAAFALHPPHLALPLSYLVDAKVARVPPGKQCQISHWGEKGISPDSNNASLDIAFSNCSHFTPLNGQMKCAS